MEDICMDDGPSSLKKWKNKFFLIDQQLRVHLIRLCEMKEELLARSGLSYVWSNKECDSIFRRNDDTSGRLGGDAKILEEPHHLSKPLLERVPSHITAPVAEDALILLPTLDEVAAAQLDLRLARKSKGPSQAKLKGLNKPWHNDYALSFEGLTWERDNGSVTDGFTRKSRAEAMRRQMDPLDALARIALSRDVEYDEIPEDNFGTATRGEEIELTLFPLAPGPYQMSYPYEGVSSPLYTKEEWDESFAPSNCVNVLSALLVSHGMELNSRYTELVTSRVRLQEKLDRKTGYVKVLRSEVTSLDKKLEKEVKKLQSQLTDARVASVGLTEELARTEAKLSEQVLIVRDLQNEIALERSKSQGYKDAADELRTEVTQFIGSGVEGLVRRLISSNEFHAALAHVASLGINYCFERGLRMGHTDADFKAAAQKVSNFHIGAEADFNKALIAFPLLCFPSLDGLLRAARRRSFEVIPNLAGTSLLVRVPMSRLSLSASIFSLLDPWIVRLVGMPISTGITALVPYVRLNGVSPLLVLGVVLWAHNRLVIFTHVPTSGLILVSDSDLL
ncbi:hypothetical protein Tco_0272702 [Tanacetum coccineum]